MDSSFLSLCVVSVFIGLIPAAIAKSKGRDFLMWWIFGSALFIIALPAALIIAPDMAAIEEQQISQGDVRKCPHCAELIKSEAKVCKHCGRDVPPAPATSVLKVKGLVDCPYCGKAIPKNAIDCVYCGREVADKLGNR